MASSMNNWLAFSLSPQELPSQSQGHTPNSVSRFISGDSSSRSGLGFNSDVLSVAEVSGDCFDLASDSTEHSLHIPNIRPHGQFDIFDAYNRPHQTHDWNMNGDGHFKTSSELSMLVGSSRNQSMEHEEPKLEDFLGGHSFTDHEQKLSGCNGIPAAFDSSGDYIYSDCSLQIPAEASTTMTTNGCGDGMNNNIGLSMIKTWLRNQPAPLLQQEKKMDVESHGNAGGNAQTLSLSMGTGSQSSSSLPLLPVTAGGIMEGGESSSENKQNTVATASLDSQNGTLEALPRKSLDTFGQRTSIYRGVTRHRWTGRYEAHLWDNSCRREGQTRKGRQVYLGGYDKEEKAARAYDLAALKYWGTTTTTNFPISNYEKEVDEMKHMTRQEYVASLRRKSSGFSRGASIYRGVTRHHQHGRWQARIGRVAGNKDLYLGTFSTQEEAAEAYDIAAIKFRGLNAVTNFDMSRYDVKSIMESSTLPIGGAAKRLKEAEQIDGSVNGRRIDNESVTSQLTDGISSYGSHHGWPTIAFQQAQPLSMQYPYGQRRGWCKQEHETLMSHHGLHDLHQLHLSNTHNFIQQPSTVHNLMNLDSSSLDHSSGSNSVIYSGSSNASYQEGVMGGNGGFAMPISTVIAEQNHDYDSMLASDPYSGRNMYYFSQQSSAASNNWMSTSVQALAPPKSSTNMAAPYFQCME